MYIENERRKSQRQRVLKGGKIVFGGKQCTFDCVVRNRSVDGARLRLATPEFVPSSFTLQIPGDAFSAAATVTNRGRTDIGVRLTTG